MPSSPSLLAKSRTLLFSHHIRWFEALLVFIVLLGFYLIHIQTALFHPDEANRIATSDAFEEFFTGRFNSRVWKKTYWTSPSRPSPASGPAWAAAWAGTSRPISSPCGWMAGSTPASTATAPPRSHPACCGGRACRWPSCPPWQSCSFFISASKSPAGWPDTWSSCFSWDRTISTSSCRAPWVKPRCWQRSWPPGTPATAPSNPGKAPPGSRHPPAGAMPCARCSGMPSWAFSAASPAPPR